MNATFLMTSTTRKLAQIQEALSLGTALKIHYLSTTTAALTQRECASREVKIERNNAYLVGFCKCCVTKKDLSGWIISVL